MRLFISVFVTVILAMGFGSRSTVQAQENERICDAFVNSPDADRVLYYMGEGAGLLAARQYGGAIHSYSCIIEQLDPQFIGAYAQRAIVYTLRQEYELAIEDYTTALELDADFNAALNNRGVVYAAMREYDLALADFERLLSLNASNVLAYINRGVIRAIQGEFESAIADMEQAISLSDMDSIVADLRNPDRPSDAPPPEYDPAYAQMYAILGIIYSGFALDNYNDYLLLRGGSADARVQSAAGALESRFNFELRLDDGTWLLAADLTPTGTEE